MMKHLSFFLALFFVCINLKAQEKKTIENKRNWFQYYFQLKLSKKINLTGDCGLRYAEKYKEKINTLGRLGFQYEINNKLSFSLGGAYFSQFNYDKIFREEWRAYQEVLYKSAYQILNYSHRFRVEERYFENIQTKKSDFTVRFRYRIYFNLPLNHSGMNEDYTLFLHGGDEIFLHSGKLTESYFDQNRLLIGLGFKWNANTTLQLTWNQQYAQRNKTQFENSSIVWFSLFQNFSLVKSTK